MILVDTSVWVDHLRAGQRVLQRLLEAELVLGHPWVTGELALGHLAQRQEILELLNQLPSASTATAEEMLVLVDRHGPMGSGIGYVDVQLIAATLITPGAQFWTRDKRLAATAVRLGIAFEPTVGPRKSP